MQSRAGPARAGEGEREVAVADRLHSTAIHLLRRLRREDDSAGLSAPQLSALSVVVHAGPVSLGALAAAEQVRPPTVTRTVRSLEAAGLVVREADAADRRVARVRATAAGRRVLEEGRRRRVASLAGRLARLEPGDLAALERAAGILERVLGAEWQGSGGAIDPGERTER
jgi:DNA-binding MarR family transcriptional regulator